MCDSLKAKGRFFRLCSHSRTDLFRRSLHDYFANVGESEIAALLSNAESEKL